MTAFPEGTILGYPRIGRRRELKKAVEAFWAGRIDEAELEATSAGLRAATRERLAEQGLGRADSAIPESFSYYDQVLDAAVTVGAIPARFEDLRSADGTIGLPAYFTIARGEGERAPLEMTKWFDTNYHYLVPEIGPDTVFSLSSDRIVRQVQEAAEAGFRTRPVVVGPVTFLALAKAADEAPEGFDPLSRLDDLVPVYAELLGALKAAGAEWVQLDEPALVSESLPASAATLGAAAERAYAVLGGLAERPAIFVAAPYAALDANLAVLAAAPIEAIGLDLVRGTVPAAVPGLADKVLVGGVIDGHNIWRGDLAAAFDTLEALRGLGAAGVAASTSTSLQHVPHDVEDESEARRAPGELAGLRGPEGRAGDHARPWPRRGARGHRRGARCRVRRPRRPPERARRPRRRRPRPHRGADRRRLRPRRLRRPRRRAGQRPGPARAAAHHDRILPADRRDPPRPRAVHPRRDHRGGVRRVPARGDRPRRRRCRRSWAWTCSCTASPSATTWCSTSRRTWTGSTSPRTAGCSPTDPAPPARRSCGATCPVRRRSRWPGRSTRSRLTAKPMKGMLTGPVTILAWSFVRDDQPLAETANQVALALRDEIADLEAAGIGVIQVDEPALRELLPLKKADQPAYLDWSVDSFRLSTGGAETATQVHTHLCYSEFGVVIDAIRALDADVTSIEAARSRMEVVTDIAASGFDHGIGPGVYDIHSPRVPGRGRDRGAAAPRRRGDPDASALGQPGLRPEDPRLRGDQRLAAQHRRGHAPRPRGRGRRGLRVRSLSLSKG